VYQQFDYDIPKTDTYRPLPLPNTYVTTCHFLKPTQKVCCWPSCISPQVYIQKSPVFGPIMLLV